MRYLPAYTFTLYGLKRNCAWRRLGACARARGRRVLGDFESPLMNLRFHPGGGDSQIVLPRVRMVVMAVVVVRVCARRSRALRRALNGLRNDVLSPDRPISDGSAVRRLRRVDI